nr:hypothetical protein [Tanacetum cinerariifolium]
MSTITDIRFVLTRKVFDAFCAKYHILEEVHLVLPNQNDTNHERSARNIELYTRFFDYANFRLPLSSFLLDILMHFRINISQLSVIGAAKLDSAAITLWMRKLILGSCIRTEMVDIDLFAFIHAPDPTKVKIVERERVGDEPLLLQTIVDHTIPLLPVAPDRADSELETIIDKLFDEGGSGSQAPRRQRKKKTIVAEAGGSSHPPKKLMKDHETPSGPLIAGKSRSAVQRLLSKAVLNVEVSGDPIPTLPIVTSSVSATPERKGWDHTDSVTGLNL